jgi:hypothetical protein
MSKVTKKGGAVAVIERAKVPVVTEEMPDYLKSAGATALDTNFTKDDMLRPVIRLTQSNSPQVKEFKAPLGEFWHSNGENLGNEILFVVLAAKRKYIIYGPRNSDKPILARAEDGSTWDKPNTRLEFFAKDSKKPLVINTRDSVEASGLAEFGTSDPSDPDSSPVATLLYEFLVLLPERLDLGPAVFTLSRTQIGPGRRLVTMVQTRGRTTNIHACAFIGRVVEAQNSDGDDYYNYAFQSAGFVSEEIMKEAVAMSKAFSNYKVSDADLMQAGGEDRTAGAGSAIKKF